MDRKKIKEVLARFFAFVIGVSYVLMGLVTAFETNSAAAAATLITIGSGLGLGGLFWPIIEELNVGGIQVKRLRTKLKEADAFEEAGEPEAAERIRRAALEEVAPGLKDIAEWRESIDGQIIAAIKEHDYGIKYFLETGSARRSHRPDMVVTLQSGISVAFETFIASEPATARQGLQRRLTDAATGEYDAYFVVAGSPDSSVAQYMDGELRLRLRDWLDRSEPRVQLDFEVVTSLAELDRIATAVGEFLDELERK